MKHSRSRRQCVRLLLMCMLLAALFVPAQAAAVETVGDEPICFRPEDFLTSPTPGDGVYLCDVPDETIGTLRCGGRVLKAGDVLPTDMLSTVIFTPASPCDAQTCLSYCTIWGDKLSDEALMTIKMSSGENHPPEAKDVSMETYKNLEKSGSLDASDPDGDALTYNIVSAPRRGELRLEEDGSFVYTPKENKVGKDSFTYTVTDPAGSVSNEATVSIEILRPLDKAAYADMRGDPCEFEALWLRSTGLMDGAQVMGNACFYPEQTVSRGEYLAMVMKLCGIEPEEGTLEGTFADADATPEWMKPYLCSALRRGIVRGAGGDAGLCFCPNAPVTQAQAAVMAQNILNLDSEGTSTVFAPEDAVPTWAEDSLNCLSNAGIALSADVNAPMTRRDAANMLYRLSKLV